MRVLKESGQFGTLFFLILLAWRATGFNPTDHGRRFPLSLTLLFIEKRDNPNNLVYLIFQPMFVLLFYIYN